MNPLKIDNTMKFHKQITSPPLLFCLLIQLTCHKKPTEPKTGTLTGTVLLEGEQDHSGTTVAFTPLDK